ncbi:hypothetical protein G9A89_002381 [Geosiphon pyriformis]|nr:hypothetical protein G9A89_002381 [Geosiphon pyriformis]
MCHPKCLETTPKSAYIEPEYIGSEKFKPRRNHRNINRTENSFNKLSQTIPPAVATKDNSLVAIFSFELEENEAMFSGAALDKKCPIIAMYTEATIKNTPIKLILDSGSTRSIIMLQLVNQLGFKVDCAVMSQIITANGSTKLSHGEINSFPFEVNDIVIPTKTTQELLINYNGHQARILATCSHFQKPSTNQRPTFEFEKNSVLPVIKTYQLSWIDDQRTGLLAVLTWTSKQRSKWNQKDMENGMRNRASLIENYYQEGATGMTYQAEEECIRGEMPFEAAFNRALKRLQHYSHDKNELYNTAQAKVRGKTAKKIQSWKESAKVADKVVSYNMFDPVNEFQDYYQQLCLTRQEQEQYLV